MNLEGHQVLSISSYKPWRTENVSSRRFVFVSATESLSKHKTFDFLEVCYISKKVKL